MRGWAGAPELAGRRAVAGRVRVAHAGMAGRDEVVLLEGDVDRQRAGAARAEVFAQDDGLELLTPPDVEVELPEAL